MPLNRLLAGLALAAVLHVPSARVALAQGDQVYSPSDLRELGQASLAAAVRRHGRLEDAAARRRVRTIIDSVARAAEYRQHPVAWELTANPEMNASAAPGGVMIINHGLLTFCREYADQPHAGGAKSADRRYEGCLAAVIGHEFGHLALGHTDSVATAMQRRQQIRRRTEQAEGVSGALADSLLMQGLTHERTQELDADRAGALYILRAGWEVQDAIDLFVAMDSVARASSDWRGQLTWLAGHPRAAERAALLEGHRARLKLNQRDFDDALSLIAHDVAPDSAEALLDRVLTDFPRLPAARHARAALLARKWIGQQPATVLRVRPALPVYDARFLTAVRGGSAAQALRSAQHAFADAVEVNAHPFTLATLAVLDAYAGDAAKARQRAELAAERMPDDADVQNNLGVVHFLAGRAQLAERAFQRAEQLAGRSLTPAIAFNVARSAAAVGDTGRAVQLLSRYTRFDHSSQWGREAVRLHQQLGAAAVAAAQPTPQAEDALPTVAGLQLGASLSEALATLGEPASGATPGVLRYPARGIFVLFGDRASAELIALEQRSSGSIEGVRVGDSLASVLQALGAPAQRVRRGATGQALAFDRGAWTLILLAEGEAVTSVGARRVAR